MDRIHESLSALDKTLGKYETANSLEKQIGIPKAYLALFFGIFYIFFTFINIFGIGSLLANIAGLLLPGYYSLIALETPSLADDKALLTYWVVFAFLSVIEFWSRAILYWVPFYYFFKTVFLLWAGLPYTMGAQYIYTSVLQPFAISLTKSSNSNKNHQADSHRASSINNVNNNLNTHKFD